jgi:hypothetical protein
MPSTDYDLDQDLQKILSEVIADTNFTEFNDLRDLGISVLPCVRVRMDKDGETQPCKGDPVTVKKVGPVERLFIPKKPHFIMIVDFGTWSTANIKIQKAMLHRGLMRIAAEKTDEGVKVSTRKPDIVEFTATVARFGAFSDNLLNLREAFRNSTHRIMPTMADEEQEQPGDEQPVTEE